MSSTIERKLAAIVFTDLVDFSLLSGKDENKALEIIQKQKEIVTSLLKKFKGTLHKETGDGLVLTFKTVTDAVKFSINLQRATKDLPDLNLRIGIHEGEISFKDNDILGDDVNITSRIEPFAAPGGIAISGKVQQNLLSLPEFETKYIGKPKLKGISQTIEVHCITSQGLPETNISEVSAKLEKEKSNYNIFTLTGGLLTIIGIAFWVSISIFDVAFSEEIEIIPSVGILLMENKGIEKDIFWSEMLTEELIYDISRQPDLRITSISQLLNINPAFTIEEIAEKMKIRYILSSSLFKHENRFDLFCNLIEIKTGKIIYTNKWTEKNENLLGIIENISKNILLSLDLQPNKNIIKLPTNSPLAYEYSLRADYNYRENIELHEMLDKLSSSDVTEDDYNVSINLLKKAIELDNDFIEAKINLIQLEMELYVFEHGYEKLTKDTTLIFEIENKLKDNIKEAKNLNKDMAEAYGYLHLANLYGESSNFKLEPNIFI